MKGGGEILGRVPVGGDRKDEGPAPLVMGTEL